MSSFTNNISFREFSSHIPKWGGVIETFEEDFESQNDFSKCSEYRNLTFNNTCTIDYFLLGMWSISKVSKNILCDTFNGSSYKTIR